MDDLELQKIQILGPTLASILQRFSSSPGDVDGLLFGRFSLITRSTFSDDNPSTAAAAASTSSSESPTLIATITSFVCSSSTSTFYTPTGDIKIPPLQRLLPTSASDHHHHSLIGWFSGRRRTPLRPSLRESSVTCSLSSNIQLSVQVDNVSLSPCVFLLLTTPIQEQLIHTHEYKAYQFRLSTESFQAKTLDVVNIGPAFRGHYGAFSPNSIFPALPCKLSGLSSMAEDRSAESENLRSTRRVSKDQKDLDVWAEGFDVGRLSRLIGSEATNYTVELEELYRKMLAKLDGLARLVEKSSARVLEQENHNMKLRYKVAGME
ncbi:uncharacterized protein LOC127790769 [Diospyros lotus]|uniref:uncharacterized protein LOC127790769 n=1 Tax=Diospyros lotus TaxID=55363 RepID=UPI002255AE72|nr:uncharacterized protein LOC127790769 [Diospyros lotus]